MRIFFHGPSGSITRPLVELSSVTGIHTTKYQESIDDVRAAFNLTGNTGNMVHAEAPLKLFKYNNRKSVVGDLHLLWQQYENKTQFKKDIESNFDYIILSLANLIRPDFNTNLYEILEEVDTPFITLGVGLQNDVSFSSLRPSTQKLLNIFNRKARLFGVRGKRTESWLHENGFSNAVALGCPSLYVYPEKVAKIKEFGEINKVISAGHLSDFYLSKGIFDKRVKVVTDLAKHYKSVSYVFQDEPFSFKELVDSAGIWDESTSTLNREVINSYLSVRLKENLNFNRFYFFFSTDSWRSVYCEYDLYVGDRLHAGIAAMQAGIPAIILHDDERVKELAKFYNFPSESVDNVIKFGYENIVNEQLSVSNQKRFISAYESAYCKFISEVKKAGLTPVIRQCVNKTEEALDNQGSTLIDKGNFLQSFVNGDKGISLYLDACESQLSKDEYINLLNDKKGFLSSGSLLTALELSIRLQKNSIHYDESKLLSRLLDGKLNRSEHRLMSQLMDSGNFSKVPLEIFINLLKKDHPDSYDSIINWLVKLGGKETAMQSLLTKVRNGNGTRFRVNLLISLLIEDEAIELVREILNGYGHFLSENVRQKFENITQA